MAAMEVAGSWFLSSGPVASLVLLVLLAVFLTALCSDCRRRSFELHDPDTDSSPAGLVRVVRLEEALGARENPAISEIQSDEENPVPFTPWRSHLGAPNDHADLQNNGRAAVMSVSDSAHDIDNPAPEDSANINHLISRGSSTSDDTSPPSTNQEPAEEPGPGATAAVDISSLYTRVSKRVGLAPPPAPTSEAVREEEADSPRLTDRRS